MNNNKLEILAPCGSYESVIAAVRCGADAVYVGGKKFSARQNAANFDEDEMKNAVDYCHLHGVKLYLAVNTLMFDTQLEEMLEFVKKSVTCGVDALILQDLGVYYILRNVIPDIPFHASTQITVHTPNGARLAKDLGFKRVVLSRELSKKQIEEIANIGIETEVFVHGALCMSVSGQCLMSAFIGSRSANRGQCAQPCRLSYLINGKNSCFALSLKDLSLIQHIEELYSIGVTSLKIEGRMKRPEYVASAVSACVNALDGKKADMEELRAVFSRDGFTDGYFTDNRIDMFGIRQKEDVISSQELLPKIKRSYGKESKISGIKFDIILNKNCKSVVNAKDTDGFYATVNGDIPQIAKNHPLEISQIKKQFSKLGDTIYNLEGISAKIDKDIMLPISALNSLRRNVIKKLYLQRIEANTPKYKFNSYEINQNKQKKNKSNLKYRVRIRNFNQLSEIDVNTIEYVILPIEEVEGNILECIKIKKKIIIEPPAFIINEKDINKRLEYLNNQGFKHLLCNNISYIRSGWLSDYILHGGFRLNVMNSYSIKLLEEYNLKDVTASVEMKVQAINKLNSQIPIGIIAYGQVPLMLTKNCPLQSQTQCCNCNKTLIDRTGRKIVIDCKKDYFELLNPEKIYLADKLDDFQIDFMTLLFYEESPEEVSNIVNQYIKHKINPLESFTRGLYYRGVH